MKKIILGLTLCLCQISMAENLQVFNVIGKAEVQDGNAWKPLSRRAVLKNSDVVRIDKNSSLSVLDKEKSKVYALKQSDAANVGQLIAGVANNGSNGTSKIFNHMVKSLTDGSSSQTSHNAAGCSYRGASVENDIARTLAFKQKNTSLVQINNATTDYGVKFELVDRKTDQVLPGQLYIGKEAYFRITNSSDRDLYVNVLDVNPQGELYDCLPVDEGMTMSHLLIPAGSTVDLKDHAIEFAEPAGTDHLILIAYPEPFDLRVVNKDLLKSGLTASPSCQIGVYNRAVNITY